MKKIIFILCFTVSFLAFSQEPKERMQGPILITDYPLLTTADSVIVSNGTKILGRRPSSDFIQQLSLNGNNLELTGSTSVDISSIIGGSVSNYNNLLEKPFTTSGINATALMNFLMGGNNISGASNITATTINFTNLNGLNATITGTGVISDMESGSGSIEIGTSQSDQGRIYRNDTDNRLYYELISGDGNPIDLLQSSGTSNDLNLTGDVLTLTNPLTPGNQIDLSGYHNDARASSWLSALYINLDTDNTDDFLVDGSVPMTGNILMNGNDIVGDLFGIVRFSQLTTPPAVSGNGYVYYNDTSDRLAVHDGLIGYRDLAYFDELGNGGNFGIVASGEQSLTPSATTTINHNLGFVPDANRIGITYFTAMAVASGTGSVVNNITSTSFDITIGSQTGLTAAWRIFGTGNVTPVVSGHVIENNGTPVTQRANLNFVGATFADDAGNDRTTITIDGGGSSLPMDDTTSLVRDPVDNAKQVRIDSENVGTGTVAVITVGSDIDLDNITGTHILNNTIQGTDVQDGSLTSADYAIGSVSNQVLADNAITSAKIAPNGVTNTDLYLENGTLTAGHLWAVSSTSDRFDLVDPSTLGSGTPDDDSVTPAKMADGDFGAFYFLANVAYLDANSIETIHYQDASITQNKLANSSVNADRIQDGTLGTAELDVNSGTDADGKLIASDGVGGFKYVDDQSGNSSYNSPSLNSLNGSANFAMTDTNIHSSAAKVINQLSAAETIEITLANANASEVDFYNFDVIDAGGQLDFLSTNGFVADGFTGNAVRLDGIGSVDFMETGVNTGVFKIYAGDNVSYVTIGGAVYDGQNAADPNNEVDGIAGVTIDGTEFVATSSSTVTAQNGTYALRFVQNAGDNTSCQAYVALTGVTTGQSVTATFWVYEVVGSNFEVRFRDDSQLGVTDWSIADSVAPNTVGVWTQYSLTSTALVDNPRLRVSGTASSDLNDEILVDNIVVTIN